MKRKIDPYFARTLVYGGAVLGGGGGGNIEEGLEFIDELSRYKNPLLLSPDEIDDGYIVTVAMVGAPSSKKKLSSSIIISSFEFFRENFKQEISGIITNEMGPFASVNGLLQSAFTLVPIIDAPANGRAHPLSAMGAMGLSKLKNYVSYQSGVSDLLKVYVEGDINTTSQLMRSASVVSGGIISITRNPVDIGYLRENGAVGAIDFTHKLGDIWLSRKEPMEKIDGCISFLKGNNLGRFSIDNVTLSQEGGFDIGRVTFGDFELIFWNEYMTLEKKGIRIATFPDLIVLFDPLTGLPLSSYELTKGQEIVASYTSYKNIILGSGMRDKTLFEYTEKVIGKDLIRYLDLF